MLSVNPASGYLYVYPLGVKGNLIIRWSRVVMFSTVFKIKVSPGEASAAFVVFWKRLL